MPKRAKPAAAVIDTPSARFDTLPSPAKRRPSSATGCDPCKASHGHGYGRDRGDMPPRTERFALAARPGSPGSPVRRKDRPDRLQRDIDSAERHSHPSRVPASQWAPEREGWLEEAGWIQCAAHGLGRSARPGSKEQARPPMVQLLSSYSGILACPAFWPKTYAWAGGRYVRHEVVGVPTGDTETKAGKMISVQHSVRSGGHTAHASQSAASRKVATAAGLS